MAVAMDWVSRILAVAAVMVLPGLAGQALDKRLGTSYWVLVGFATGLVVGLYQLILLTKPPASPPRK